MYAKTLVPGARIAAPSLTATTSESEALMPQLRACGWGDFGEPLRQVETASLLISHDRLQLVVAGQVLLDDINPAGPAGWWEAVDGIGGRCVVVVARSEDVDLTRPDSGSTLRALMDLPGRAVWAIVSIDHPRTSDGGRGLPRL